MPNSDKIKRFFKPRDEFIEETRILFLAKLETINKKEKLGINLNNIFVFTPFWKYSLVAIFIIIFLSGGLVIYADSNNVSVNNPLYRFKKTGEKVRLTMAPKDRKPMVNHQIAERRLEEMHGLKNMDSHTMEALSNEYRNDINLSLDGMAGLDKERLEQFKELCAKIAQTMANKVEIVKAADMDDSISDHFNEHCAEFMMFPPVPVK
ncbi:MAG: hypothetical protein NTW46_02175 [Candidatus Nealsonbacteria bacterium]|nr:hypothetical protein [Candidatus Nealsonbacteria bacterium]